MTKYSNLHMTNVTTRLNAKVGDTNYSYQHMTNVTTWLNVHKFKKTTGLHVKLLNMQNMTTE